MPLCLYLELKPTKKLEGNGKILRGPERQRGKEIHAIWGKGPNKPAQDLVKCSDNFIYYLWPYSLNMFLTLLKSQPMEWGWQIYQVSGVMETISGVLCSLIYCHKHCGKQKSPWQLGVDILTVSREDSWPPHNAETPTAFTKTDDLVTDTSGWKLIVSSGRWNTRTSQMCPGPAPLFSSPRRLPDMRDPRVRAPRRGSHTDITSGVREVPNQGHPEE